jgi:hypothetical protein
VESASLPSGFQVRSYAYFELDHIWQAQTKGTDGINRPGR